MNIIRVMGCPSYNFGSQEKYILEMAKKLESEGHKFHVIYENVPHNKLFVKEILSTGTNLITIKPRAFFYDKIKIPYLNKFLRHWYRIFDFQSIIKIRKVIKNEEIDIIHSYFGPSLYSVFVGCLMDKITLRTLGNPILSHTDFRNSRYKISSYLRNYWIYAFPIFFIDKQISISKKILDEFKYIGVKSRKLEMITSGTDVDYYNPENFSSNKPRKDFNIESEDFIIGFTGRLEGQKNLLFLIEVFEDLLKEIPKAKLVLVGSGHLNSELRELCSNLGILEKVIFTGRRDNVAEILKMFDVFVLPSIFEGMPSSLLEAMSMERCCITSDLDVFSEVIKNGINGYICELNNKIEFSNRVVKLYQNPANRLKIGKRARQEVKDNFNIKKRVNRTLELYNKLLNRSNV